MLLHGLGVTVHVRHRSTPRIWRNWIFTERENISPNSLWVAVKRSLRVLRTITIPHVAWSTGSPRPWIAKMTAVTHVQHPLVEHHLVHLRNRHTSSLDFRLAVGRLAVLLAYEATKDLQTCAEKVDTPLCQTVGQVLKHRIGLVPILRAGLGMVDPILNLIPNAEVWHVGLYRDEDTALPVEYYSKLPDVRPMDVALIVDPMLATGGSATAALATLQRRQVPITKLLSIIASLEGIERVQREFPDAQIYVCAIDPELNAQKFIVPGLGDAGDRIFNTMKR